MDQKAFSEAAEKAPRHDKTSTVYIIQIKSLKDISFQ